MDVSLHLLSHWLVQHDRRAPHFDFITLIRGYLCKPFYYVIAHLCGCWVSAASLPISSLLTCAVCLCTAELAGINADFWNHQAAEFNGMQASEAT